jgi:hypothetical protein
MKALLSQLWNQCKQDNQVERVLKDVRATSHIFRVVFGCEPKGEVFVVMNFTLILYISTLEALNPSRIRFEYQVERELGGTVFGVRATENVSNYYTTDRLLPVVNTRTHRDILYFEHLLHRA